MAEENEAEAGPEGIGAGPDAVALGAAMARASGAAIETFKLVTSSEKSELSHWGSAHA